MAVGQAEVLSPREAFGSSRVHTALANIVAFRRAFCLEGSLCKSLCVRHPARRARQALGNSKLPVSNALNWKNSGSTHEDGNRQACATVAGLLVLVSERGWDPRASIRPRHKAH